MLWAVGFVAMFLIGGLSGIYLGTVPIDVHASDTYYIVAHIHYVLYGGSVFTIMAGVYYWFPKMTGRMYSETLGKWHFWLTFIAFNATFFPMHWTGLQGQPRRTADYVPKFEGWNLFMSISAFVLGAAMLIFLYNVIHSWARGPKRRTLACPLDRVAGVVTAAALQLRRDPAGRRRALRVRRSRCTPRGLEREQGRGPSGGAR